MNHINDAAPDAEPGPGDADRADEADKAATPRELGPIGSAEDLKQAVPGTVRKNADRPDTDGSPPEMDGRFSGRSDFRELVRMAFAKAADEGWRRIVISDASFEDWPLGERSIQESLAAWSETGREFVMLARRYDTVEREHARFVAWRRQWSHIIECRICPTADPLELPSAIWSDAWAMRRLDPVRSAGVCGREPERRIALREEIDEWLRKSSPGFAATTLGL